MIIKIIIPILLTSSIFANMPEMSFEKGFYIENKCDNFTINEKEFNPKDCFYKKTEKFELDYCITVDKAIMCISSKDRTNFILNTDYIITNNEIILKNKIIEVNKIVYKDNSN